MSNKVKGTVKWFKKEKGFGFIVQENQIDVFFHFKSINMEGYKTLNPGDKVEFNVIKTSKGLEAKEVTLLCASEVKQPDY